MVFKNQGIIYKIYSVNSPNEKYIGKTSRSLISIFSEIKTNYKRYKNNKTSYRTVYDIFDKYGVNNCTIQQIDMLDTNDNITLEECKRKHLRNYQKNINNVGIDELNEDIEMVDAL